MNYFSVYRVKEMQKHASLKVRTAKEKPNEYYMYLDEAHLGFYISNLTKLKSNYFILFFSMLSPSEKEHEFVKLCNY